MPNPLPPALKLILPVLADDQGRARARTLLFIAGVGPDVVQQNAPDLDAALGASSPGPAGLADLVSKTRTAMSASSPKIARQHVISKVILRHFCEPGLGNAGLQLMGHDLLNGNARPNGPGGVGYVRNFVKIDSQATEGLWQKTENNLPQAINAAISRSVLADSGMLSVLRDAIALHFVRNPQALEVHEQTFADAFQNVADTLTRTPAAAEAFRRRYGLEPAGSQALRLGAEELLAAVTDMFAQGALFRLRVQDLFETAQDRFQNSGVEILEPADPGTEFLIGDTPALPVDFATGNAGVRAGITFGAANTVMLPLTPRLLISLGPHTAMKQVPPEFVERVNHVQVRSAQRYVHHRLTAGFGADIAAWRATPAPPFTGPLSASFK